MKRALAVGVILGMPHRGGSCLEGGGVSAAHSRLLGATGAWRLIRLLRRMRRVGRRVRAAGLHSTACVVMVQFYGNGKSCNANHHAVNTPHTCMHDEIQNLPEMHVMQGTSRCDTIKILHACSERCPVHASSQLSSGPSTAVIHAPICD